MNVRLESRPPAAGHDHLPEVYPPQIRLKAGNCSAVQGIVLMLAALTVMVLVAQQPMNFGPSDFWVHAGSIEIFSRDLSNPRHTYGVDPALSGQLTSNEGLRARHFSPWEFLLSIIKRAAGLSTLQSILVGSMLSVGALFAGMILFGLELNRLTGQHWLTTTVPVSVLFLIGTGTGWSGNVYWNLLPEVAAYPSTVAVALGFIGWAIVLKLLRSWRGITAAALVIVSSLILVIHQFQFLFYLLFCVCIVFFSMCAHANGTYRVKVGMLLLAALPLGALWPYFNPFDVIHTATQLAPDVFRGPSTFYLHQQVIERFGIALMGVPLALWAPRQFRLTLVVYIGVTMFMWLAALVIDLPSAGHRWAIAALLGMQISLAFALARALDLVCCGQRRGNAPTAAALVCLVAVLGTAVGQAFLAKYRYGDAFPFSTEFASQRDIHRWTRFASAMPSSTRDAVVIADPRTSFAMTALGLTPLVFSSSFRKVPSSPTVTILSQVYAPETPATKRCDLLRTLVHAHYLVDSRRNDPLVLEQLDAMGQIVQSAEGISLYRVRDSVSCLVTT